MIYPDPSIRISLSSIQRLYTSLDMANVTPIIKHMNSNLKTTKETLAILGCANSTFYSHLDKQAIKPIKVGRRSFFTLDQIEILKSSLDIEPSQTNPKESGENIERSGEIDPERSGENIERSKRDSSIRDASLSNHLKEEIERLREKSEQDRAKIEGLMREVGRWEGLAKNQEKKILLLEEKEAENQIIDAETIPEEIPEKKGWWQKLWE